MYSQYLTMAITYAVLFFILGYIMWSNYKLSKFRDNVSPGNTIRIKIGKHNVLATVDIRPCMETVHVVELARNRKYRTSICNIYPI